MGVGGERINKKGRKESTGGRKRYIKKQEGERERDSIILNDSGHEKEGQKKKKAGSTK